MNVKALESDLFEKSYRGDYTSGQTKDLKHCSLCTDEASDNPHERTKKKNSGFHYKINLKWH